jgi:hypothetical protein
MENIVTGYEYNPYEEKAKGLFLQRGDVANHRKCDPSHHVRGCVEGDWF